jgi:hypothetical protein
LPAEAELEALRAMRTDQKQGDHWLDYVGRARRLEWVDGRHLGLVELCDRCEQVALWIDPRPKDQLRLIWLLNYARHYERVISKLVLIQSALVIGAHSPEALAAWRLPAVKIRSDHLEVAGRAWRAYRASTPQDWFNLLSMDLSALPQLQPTVVEMLEELPGRTSGLGATEMRILELVDPGASGQTTFSRAMGIQINVACSTIGSSALYWTGSRIVPCPRYWVSSRDPSRWECTMIANVTNATGKASSS